jgi:hypothetical protein
MTKASDNLVERLRARTEMEDHNGTIYPDALVNPDGPEAADRIIALREALEECRGVLSNIPAPHDYGLWQRMCRAIRRAEQELGKDAALATDEGEEG